MKVKHNINTKSKTKLNIETYKYQGNMCEESLYTERSTCKWWWVYGEKAKWSPTEGQTVTINVYMTQASKEWNTFWR